MHPILAERRVLAAYLAIWLAPASLLATVLAGGPVVGCGSGRRLGVPDRLRLRICLPLGVVRLSASPAPVDAHSGGRRQRRRRGHRIERACWWLLARLLSAAMGGLAIGRRRRRAGLARDPAPVRRRRSRVFARCGRGLRDDGGWGEAHAAERQALESQVSAREAELGIAGAAQSTLPVQQPQLDQRSWAPTPRARAACARGSATSSGRCTWARRTWCRSPRRWRWSIATSRSRGAVRRAPPGGADRGGHALACAAATPAAAAGGERHQARRRRIASRGARSGCRRAPTDAWSVLENPGRRGAGASGRRARTGERATAAGRCSAREATLGVVRDAETFRVTLP